MEEATPGTCPGNCNCSLQLLKGIAQRLVRKSLMRSGTQPLTPRDWSRLQQHRIPLLHHCKAAAALLLEKPQSSPQPCCRAVVIRCRHTAVPSCPVLSQAILCAGRGQDARLRVPASPASTCKASRAFLSSRPCSRGPLSLVMELCHRVLHLHLLLLRKMRGGESLILQWSWTFPCT